MGVPCGRPAQVLVAQLVEGTAGFVRSFLKRHFPLSKHSRHLEPGLSPYSGFTNIFVTMSLQRRSKRCE